MINREMKSDNKPTEKKPSTHKPNEVGGVVFSSSVKIYDPNTKVTLVHKRGDD